MRRGPIALCTVLLACGPAPAAAPPYGCWPIRDAVERLACFDMAFGPPDTRFVRPETMTRAPDDPAAKAPSRTPPGSDRD